MQVAKRQKNFQTHKILLQRLQTLASVTQGEQVFITYGQQSNDKLLQYYGFVEPKNPADVFMVTNMLHALQDLPYLNISKERIQCVQQAGLLTSLEQVCAQLSGVIMRAASCTSSTNSSLNVSQTAVPY